jgi:phosphomethylpyrimidine synthase
MKNLSSTVTTGPLPASRRVWHAGVLPPEIRIPMREIELHPTAGEPPITVHDSSGSDTDPKTEIAIERGPLRPREAWIAARGDTEQYQGRHARPEDTGFAQGERLTSQFPVRHQLRRAKSGRAVTQMAYARAGIGRNFLVKFNANIGNSAMPIGAVPRYRALEKVGGVVQKFREGGDPYLQLEDAQ